MSSQGALLARLTHLLDEAGIPARRLPVHILGTDTYVASAEDTIIAKLEWAREGESERQLRDVAGMLSLNATTLDHAYLERWIAALDLSDAWDRAQHLD